MGNKVIRIAMIGPESSGKSTIAAHISNCFGFTLVSEYAREYLGALSRPYELSEILHIYQKQMELELELLIKSPKGIISDTECINGLVWCNEVFGTTPPWFEDQIRNKPYDLYLLTSPDIPYEADPLRENPGRGAYFFERFMQELKKRGLPFSVINGEGATRLNLVEKTVSAFIAGGHLPHS